MKRKQQQDDLIVVRNVPPQRLPWSTTSPPDRPPAPFAGEEYHRQDAMHLICGKPLRPEWIYKYMKCLRPLCEG